MRDIWRKFNCWNDASATVRGTTSFVDVQTCMRMCSYCSTWNWSKQLLSSLRRWRFRTCVGRASVIIWYFDRPGRWVKCHVTYTVHIVKWFESRRLVFWAIFVIQSFPQENADCFGQNSFNVSWMRLILCYDTGGITSFKYGLLKRCVMQSS